MSKNDNQTLVSHEAEYRQVKKDLLKVFLINCVFLAALLVIYFTNRQHHYLENIFGKVIGA
jgi:hypothetical protein